MAQNKKFISPGAWFSLYYPADWSEFEDGEDSFLFYNPDNWTGNFRISAYKGEANYGSLSLQEELRLHSSAQRVRVGDFDAVYSKEMFAEEDVWYTSHEWMLDAGNMVIECSFTLPRGEDASEGLAVAASVEARKEGVKYPAEIIPVRLAEIYQINEAYDLVSRMVKEHLSKDFQGQEEDVAHMQQLVDMDLIGRKKKDIWQALGITLCTILADEVNGLEWYTLMDGNREAPVLIYLPTHTQIDPMKLVWSKVKNGEKVDLVETYKNIL